MSASRRLRVDIVRDPLRAAFERDGAEERGRFHVGQLLTERRGREPDPIVRILEFQLREQL